MIDPKKTASMQSQQPQAIPTNNFNPFGDGEGPLDLPPGLHPIGDGVPHAPARDPVMPEPVTPPAGGGETGETQGAQAQSKFATNSQKSTQILLHPPTLQDDKENER